MLASFLIVSFILISQTAPTCRTDSFEVGVGIADITGPIAQVNTMGYAHAQLSGLHTRLFSRAFAFRDSSGSSAAYAVLDLAMVSHLLAFTIGKRLSEASAGRYSESNVMLSATHTHAGPGGYNQDLFLALNTPGFDRAYFNYIVDGVVQSILEADRGLTPARVFSNSGHLYNASVNRHPHQYLLNPAAERARYPANVDTEMYMLRFDNARTGAPLGSISWFPVHGTSLKISNRYVSGDNKGVASQLMERHFNGGGHDWLPGEVGSGRASFVAAFPQSHSGDVTPNTRGVFRIRPVDDGEDRNGRESAQVKCNTTVFNTFECESKGPGEDQYESAMIIGRMQFESALKLHQAATKELPSPLTLSVIHDTRDVSEESFPAALASWNTFKNSSSHLLRACKAAIGYGFCAGTADGKAVFSYFNNGQQRASVLVDAVRDLLAKATPEDVECQGSKQICLNVGEIYWSGIPFMSSQIPTQILRIGPVFILALPTEVTTMAGRRLMESLSQTKGFPKDGKVQINGLSNGYYFYVATEEEYNGNYYEAGATLFGPHTLNYYAWHAGRMLRSILTGSAENDENFRPRPTPPGLDKSDRLDGISSEGSSDRGIGSLDFAGFGIEFGQQMLDLKSAYQPGDTVRLKFVACNPRHSFGIRGHSFVRVERYNDQLHLWQLVRNDASLDTRFLWQQGDFFQSFALISWEIPPRQRPGVYRIGYRGHCRTFSSALAETSRMLGWRKQQVEEPRLLPISGESGRFRIVASGAGRPSKSEDAPSEKLRAARNFQRAIAAASVLSTGANAASGFVARSNEQLAVILLLQLLLALMARL